MELGDCQGSDSPIPQHLAQVLAYLVKSDLVLYVVSSRVGLRQADFQFLAELQRMGLAAPYPGPAQPGSGGAHLLRRSWRSIRDRVAQELSPWQPEPRLYAFSALKLLLDRRRARGESLDPREAAVLQVWATGPGIRRLFGSGGGPLRGRLAGPAAGFAHAAAWPGGSLSQVQMVARGLREQLELTRDLLTQGPGRHQGDGSPSGGPAPAPATAPWPASARPWKAPATA